MSLDISVTPKQDKFMKATAFEVLFGGAAGGGKSYAQLIDGLLFALKYPGSKQVAFRKTYPELEKSLIRASKELFPREVAEYNESKHIWTFKNGSIFEFASLPTESDKYNFQSAEYDIIRFDELTHFSEETYIYMLSRCRGTNGYPKQIKSSTNPGGKGHLFVKERFIEIGKWEEEHDILGSGTRIFIPAKVQDNPFLTNSDPEYIKRLENLGDKEKKALLYGDWDISEGRYFGEFDRDIHVCEPFAIPSHWRIYRAFDYGLDCFACLWIAVDERGNSYVYNELHESGLIVSSACAKMQEYTDRDVYATFAPPDMWNRHRETGRSTADIFRDNGIVLIKAPNDRVSGWFNVKEALKVFDDEQGCKRTKLTIFSNCKHLIKSLSDMQTDERDPNDCAIEPHEITHQGDALRYFCASRAKRAEAQKTEYKYNFEFEKPKPNPLGQGIKLKVV